MVSFDLSPELKDLQGRVREFIRNEVIPMERDPRCGPHGPSEDLREALMAKARQRGLLSPQVSPALGGMGLSHMECAVVFEEAGYSVLGPVAMNLFAPDEGNMHLLSVVATSEQKMQWLEPLARGHIRSCFCMTEPAPGAGSDPSMLATTAKPDGDHYQIDGKKWLITGATGARLGIVMARIPDVGATMFLTDMNAEGIRVERSMDTLDTCFPGGHGVVSFSGLRVHRSQILGEPGQGFRYAQVRLSPARLTHCMRWLGAARRAHDTALAYVAQRQGFGKPMAQHEGVGFMLADNDMDMHQSRLVVWHCASVLDQGHLALQESSRAKVMVSEAAWRVVDRSVQMLGGQGVTGETAVARIFADMRGFRIYDGPSEVHRWSLAKHLVRNAIQSTSQEVSA